MSGMRLDGVGKQWDMMTRDIITRADGGADVEQQIASTAEIGNRKDNVEFGQLSKLWHAKPLKPRP